jgi:ribonuclease E
MPQSIRTLKLYEDPAVPLFTRFQIESQIESAYSHKVSLPSGGSIVIDHTEALTAIDINSARSTKGGDIEQTAFNTNLEAAEEIGRQLRIRDLGGLVVVDFIDMGPQRNQREVENRLREAVRADRARIQIGKISRFGLLELSRQRLRPSLEESTQLVCPRCSGNGVVRGVESLALAVLRLVGEEARKDRTAKVIALVPVEVGNYILNEKREWVQNIQQSNHVIVVIVGDPELETPNYSIRRVRDDETEHPENTSSSYSMVQVKEDPGLRYEQAKPAPKPDTPAVAEVLPETPAPIVVPTSKPAPAQARRSLFSRFFLWLGGGASQPEEEPASQRRRADSRRTGNTARGSDQGARRSSGPGGNRKPRSRPSGNRGGRSNRPAGQGGNQASGGNENAGAGSSAGPGAGSGSAAGSTSGASAASNSTKSSGQGSRNRRSRGRRGRGSGSRSQNSSDQNASAAPNETQPGATASNNAPAAKPEPRDEAQRIETPRSESPITEAPRTETPRNDTQRPEPPRSDLPKPAAPHAPAPIPASAPASAPAPEPRSGNDSPT